MKSHVQALVIGGGVVGASVLYHLTKYGWKDVALIERKELTAGSTWHAAAGFHVVNGDPNVAKLQAYTVDLYKQIEKESGQDVGMHLTGGVNFASTPERWEALKADWAMHRLMGLDTELIGPEEIAKLCPIVDTSKVIGGIYDKNEGHLDPYGVTHAFAKAARDAGAEIYRQNCVTALNQRPDGSWEVITEKGTIIAEHIVNAAGLWAREVGEMAGVKLPLIPMEHHYLITENIPEIMALDKELPLCMDLDGEIYVRQEQNGALLGIYEHNSTPWALDGTPWDYGETDLLPPNLDRISDSLMKGFERFPSIAEAGIKRIVNGPFTFSPDGNPLVGPVPGVRNYWAACGVMAGFCQGGGIGLTLAQWMINGEPEQDCFSMDVARYGKYASPKYTTTKVKEFYERRFGLSYPNEEWKGGRPNKTTPIYEKLKEQNAVFGASYGQEYALYFAPKGEVAEETPSYRRSNSFGPVGEECRAVRSAVGLFESSAFGKYEISGPDATTWLDNLLASDLPKVGKIKLGVMLSDNGRLKGDFTVSRLSENRYILFASGYLQSFHMRWFNDHQPESGVTIRNITDEVLGFTISGPNSRPLMEKITGSDFSKEAFPFMSLKEMDVGLAPALVMRLSLSGELGYEIYVPSQNLLSLYNFLMEEGKEFGLRLIGVRALLSLRLEKGFGIWSREFSADYTPNMAGLNMFVSKKKTSYIGSEAVLADKGKEPEMKLVTLDIEAVDADAHGYEPIWVGDKYVGFTTSGGYGHCVNKSLALGYINIADVDEAATYHVHLVGEKYKAKILAGSAYDPTGSKMRG